MHITPGAFFFFQKQQHTKCIVEFPVCQHVSSQYTALNSGGEHQMLDGSSQSASVLPVMWSADPWTRTETPIQMWKNGPFWAFHSFKLTPPRRVPANRSCWTDYTELSEMLAINVQAVSWQPSLKARAHQTAIIWKGQRWLKLLTQSALRANACREAKIWWVSTRSSKPISRIRIEWKHVYCPLLCIFVWRCPLVHACFYCSFTTMWFENVLNLKVKQHQKQLFLK